MKHIIGLVLLGFFLATSCAQETKSTDEIIEKVKLSQEYLDYRALTDERQTLMQMYDLPADLKANMGQIVEEDYAIKFEQMEALDEKVRSGIKELINKYPDTERDEFFQFVKNYIDQLNYPEDLKAIQIRTNELIYGSVVQNQIQKILDRFPSITKEEVLNIQINDLKSNQN